MRNIQRYIDKIGGNIIVFILSIFNKQKPREIEPKRFLIIKLWALGDSVISIALIKGIRESYKNCCIDVLILPHVQDVFECADVDNIKYLNSFSDLKYITHNSKKYDIVFDCEPYFNLSAIISYFAGKERIGFANQFRSRLYTMTTEFRKDQHMVQNYLDMLRLTGIKYDADKLEKLDVPKNEKQRVEEYISEIFSNKILIGICPGISESTKNRMWFEERFAQLADRIMDKFSCKILFIDSQKNIKTSEKIMSLMQNSATNTIGTFSLTETFHLISSCSIFISNDTGPMHIAAAQGCKTIGLFGPNTPVLWGPFGKNNISIYKTTLAPSIQNDKGIFKNKNRLEYMGPIKVNNVFEKVNLCLNNITN
jgi:heptosyltransferase-2